MKKHTAREKLVWVRGIKSFQSVSLVECKLFIDDSMVVLVQFLVLQNLFPYTMPVIMIRYCIFITFSPQEVFQDQKRVKLETQFAVQPDRIPENILDTED